jgi:uncharacterized YigZ family protein
LDDTYYTINQLFEATFKDKGSRFFAFAHPIKTAEEAKVLLEKYRKDARFKGACHFCFAYKLGVNNSKLRSSDDGEPAGTAGKPILNQIESFKLSDIIIIVVRFFGGTLLGTSGLIHAYKQAAIDCLSIAKPIEVVLRNNFSITFSYNLQSEIDRLLKGFNIAFDEKNFAELVNYKLKIKSGELALLKETINKSAIANQIKINEY